MDAFRAHLAAALGDVAHAEAEVVLRQPATGDTVALASDDVALQNNMAQKNVFDFEALT